MKVKDRKAMIAKAVEAVGTQKELAYLCKVTQQNISRLLNDDNATVTAEMAMAIHNATGGKVSRAELRPDIFGKAA